MENVVFHNPINQSVIVTRHDGYIYFQHSAGQCLVLTITEAKKIAKLIIQWSKEKQ